MTNNNNILVVAAHPDDEVLGCGATIAKHTDNGGTAQVIFVADGYSSRDAGDSREVLAIKASEVLGCNPPIFLNFPDNQLDSVPILSLIKEIEAIVSSFSPGIVYTHHFGDLNIDHQITHRAVMTACRPEPESCVKEIYSFEVLSATHWQSNSMNKTFNPNCFVGISGYLERKVQALECYDVEMREYPHARSYDSIRSLATLRGAVSGNKYAEAFQVERIVS